MDNLLEATLKSQIIPSGLLFLISLIAWPLVIGILRDCQGKDRPQFNCVPKLNEVTRQLCYDKYNSAMSPRLTPSDFAGITFGLSSFAWLTVTLLNIWLLRRIHDKKDSKANRRKNVDHYYWVFIGHICYQLVLLVVMMVLFCCYQKLEYPSAYRCFLANTTLTVFNQVAVNFTCNDMRYNEKSKVNIAIIVVFSLSIVLSLAAITQLKLQGKQNTFKHLLRNLKDDPGHQNPSLGNDVVEGPNTSPLGKKLVTEFPGIGDIGERNLKKKGFEYASQIFGQFLVLEEDEGKFTDWLQQCGIGEAYCGHVSLALHKWSVHYFNSQKGKKLGTELPEIGDAGERKLKDIGFEYFSQIFGQFLVLQEDEGKFKDWLQQCEIGEAYCGHVYSALHKWSAVEYFE